MQPPGFNKQEECGKLDNIFALAAAMLFLSVCCDVSSFTEDTR